MDFLDRLDGPSDGGWTLRLPNDEALVLFDFLSRFNAVAAELDLFEDQAEQRALWDLQAALETVSSEILSPDYRRALEAARERVRDRAQ